jgi:hypothetical protein
MAVPARLLAATLAVACAVACGGWDPLELSKRPLPGGYTLERIESNYFLTDAMHPPEVGGVIEGVVLNIGWNDQLLLAECHFLFRAEPDAIMIIDLNTGKIDGPVSREELARHPELTEIKMLDAAAAWASLRPQSEGK